MIDSSPNSVDSSRRPSCIDNPEAANHKGVVASHLVGEENEDQEIVCNWFATSYGEVNKEYHEAYSREILRQIRTESEEKDV